MKYSVITFEIVMKSQVTFHILLKIWHKWSTPVWWYNIYKRHNILKKFAVTFWLCTGHPWQGYIWMHNIGMWILHLMLLTVRNSTESESKDVVVYTLKSILIPFSNTSSLNEGHKNTLKPSVNEQLKGVV